jgi:endogenous inhibitor of DNA gyrase (YacG/DUF329 family)
MAERPDFPNQHRADCPECGSKVPNDAALVHTRGMGPRVECPSCGAWFVVRRTDAHRAAKEIRSDGGYIAVCGDEEGDPL